MEEDGTMMAYLILKEFQLEITVGISGIKDKLGSINSTKLSHNIKDMLDHMQSLCEEF